MAEHRQLCPKLLSLLKVWLKQTSLGGEEKKRIEEAPSGDRTHDRTLTKRMLYQLSYRGHGADQVLAALAGVKFC